MQKNNVRRWILVTQYLLLIGCINLCMGCAGFGKVEQTYYLQGGFGQNTLKDVYVDKFAVGPNFTQRIYGKTLLVQLAQPTQTIDQESSKISKSLTEDDFTSPIQPKFERRIADAMWQTQAFRDVCAAQDPVPIIDPDLILKVALTQWYEGIAFVRAFLIPPMGAARVQWEGALVDAATGEVLMSFADARLHPGGPAPLGLGLKVWKGYLLVPEIWLSSINELALTIHDVVGIQNPMLPETTVRPLYRKQGEILKQSPSMSVIIPQSK